MDLWQMEHIHVIIPNWIVLKLILFSQVLWFGLVNGV
jgi:hypothetical protein